MDLEEYLLAMGKKEMVEKIKQCYETNTQMDELWHHTALDFYKEYLAVGGMPECVKLYKETKNYTLVRDAQNEILENYLNDMSKYNTGSQIRKTRGVFNQLGSQLSKKNTKFQKKLLKGNYRADDLADAIEWLKLSGIVTQVTKVEHIMKPLYANQDFSSYKIYYSDLGLLAARNSLQFYDIMSMSPDINNFKGGIAENYVNFHLRNNGYATYFWNSKREAEVDFIIEKEGKIIPVEVKSSDNTKAKSLKVYIENYHPDYAIKVSMKNFGFVNGIKTVPLYAVFCL